MRQSDQQLTLEFAAESQSEAGAAPGTRLRSERVKPRSEPATSQAALPGLAELDSPALQLDAGTEAPSLSPNTAPSVSIPKPRVPPAAPADVLPRFKETRPSPAESKKNAEGKLPKLLPRRL